MSAAETKSKQLYQEKSTPPMDRHLSQFSRRVLRQSEDPVCTDGGARATAGIEQGASMKLHSTITSAYARKVWVVAHETSLIDRITRIPTNPHHDEYLRKDNPLCRVPALILDNGEVLFDSPVICEYLDSLHNGPKLFPAAGDARWHALRLQAVGDGILDANVSRRNEVIRDPGEQSPAWITRQMMGVEAAYAWLEARIGQLHSKPLTIGHIAVGCALGYSDLRFAGDTWRSRCPQLAAWHAEFEKRPSMAATQYAKLKATLSPEMIKEGPNRHSTAVLVSKHGLIGSV